MTTPPAHGTRLERILGVPLADDAMRQWPPKRRGDQRQATHRRGWNPTSRVFDLRSADAMPAVTPSWSSGARTTATVASTATSPSRTRETGTRSGSRTTGANHSKRPPGGSRWLTRSSTCRRGVWPAVEAFKATPNRAERASARVVGSRSPLRGCERLASRAQTTGMDGKPAPHVTPFSPQVAHCDTPRAMLEAVASRRMRKRRVWSSALSELIPG